MGPAAGQGPQQYGQVPQPGQVAQPGLQDPYGQQLYGQPPPKKSRRWLKYGIPGVVLAFVALVTVGSFLSSPVNAEEGDCLHVPEFGNYPDESPEEVDCDDDDANIKIATKYEDHDQVCPEGTYRRLEFDDGPALCGMLNADQGDCFTNFALTEEEGPEQVRCDDPSAEVEVVTLVEGSLDVESACGGTEATDVRVYSDPETVICIASPNVT